MPVPPFIEFIERESYIFHNLLIGEFSQVDHHIIAKHGFLTGYSMPDTIDLQAVTAWMFYILTCFDDGIRSGVYKFGADGRLFYSPGIITVSWVTQEERCLGQGY